MKKTFSKRKSAFSLIELSIVLIIIGLLIAGVTGGASLIKSSELRSVMGEARGYSVAVNAFFTQYDALPGDFSTAVGSEATYFGDGNSQIEYARVFNTVPGSEGSVAWHMLSSIGAIDRTYTADSASVAQVPGTNLPASKIKTGGWAFDFIDGQNVVVLTGTTTPAADDGDSLATLASGVITPSDALAIDAKIDDGVANAGKVRGVLSDCLNTGDNTLYNTASETGNRVCALSYQVDVNI